VNISISDADLRLQKEYSAPFFGGEKEESENATLKGVNKEELPDILSKQ
jgi:hypothetical protein